MSHRFKVLLVGAIVSSLGASLPVMIQAQAPDSPRSHCYSTEGYGNSRDEGAMHVPTELTYTTGEGVVVTFEKREADSPRYSQPIRYTASVPIAIDGEPNADFDRLYALLMKGFDSGRISRVCLDGDPSPNASLRLKGLTLRHLPEKAQPELQKVTICDDFEPQRCSGVTLGGSLSVYDVSPR